MIMQAERSVTNTMLGSFKHFRKVRAGRLPARYTSHAVYSRRWSERVAGMSPVLGILLPVLKSLLDCHTSSSSPNFQPIATLGESVNTVLTLHYHAFKVQGFNLLE